MLCPLIVLFAAFIMMTVERARPRRRWKPVPGWWGRVALLNGFQGAIIVAGGLTWQNLLSQWTQSHWNPWDAEETLGVFGAGLAGYLVCTFVYYWWHRARHEVPLLWRFLHQMHHSPARIEVATSFYKHPLEVAANSLLSGAILFIVCGLGPASAAVVVLISGLAELFYHWNVTTPYWLGFVIQRPESHCLHHQRGVHSHNYSDLPLWDMLFGTFQNPRSFEAECGFDTATELQIGEMLRCVDVSSHSGRMS
jgi:sterol desaturase/sphingolipid hydroxylase (fatty acid hydroxylase superfamily)